MKACLIRAGALGLALATGLSGQTPFVNFETAPVHPVALSPDRKLLAVCNLPRARVELFDVSAGMPVAVGSVLAGVDPVSVRFRTANELWVVNHISDSVSIIKVDPLRIEATLDTLGGPADVVFAGPPERAFVSCAKADTVQVFDPVLRRAIASVSIDGDRPKALAVSPDGQRVYAAIFESGNASTILAPAHTLFATAPAPSVVAHPDGPHGGQDPPPNDGAQFNPPINPSLDSDYLPTGSLIVKKSKAGRWMDDNHGDWTEFVSGTNAALSGRVAGWDMPDHDLAIIDAGTFAITYASGLMNICMDLAPNPVTGTLAVVGTEAINERRFEPNLRGTFLRVNLALVDPAALTATIVDLNPHLDYTRASIPPAERNQSIGDPRSVVWNAQGTRAYIAGMGSRNLVVVDAAGGRAAAQPIELGEGPVGLALDEPRARLYVLNRFSSSLSVLDTVTMTVLANLALYDPTPAAIKDGRKHLYDTRRNSGLGQAACASCHIDARFDRLAWDLGNPAGEMIVMDVRTFHPMKGPMVTQTLQDMRGPLHWRADRETLEDFNVTFTGLLGADAQLSPQEMGEFKEFLATITFPPNRLRNFDNTLSTNLPLPGHFVPAGEERPERTPLPNGNAEAGFQVFALGRFHVGDIGGVETVQRCDLCHNGDSGLGVEAGPFLPLARNHGLPFKGAQLRNLAEKTGMDRGSRTSRAGFGFMHDGRADTLTRFVVDGLGIGESENGTIDPNQDRADVVAFLLSFAGGGLYTGSDGDHESKDTPAAAGRQITLNAPGTNALLSEMLALAGQPGREVDLIASGPAGAWFYNRESGRFQTRRNNEDVSVSALVSLPSPGHEFTFTLAPAGTGSRLAVDQDADGYLDQTELDHGFDPLDPLSKGTNASPYLVPVPPYYASLPWPRTHPGLFVSADIDAADSDAPLQTLTFSLAEDAPPGAAIDPATGVFSWTPPATAAAGDYRIAIRVQDDGWPPLSDTKGMIVTIVPLGLKWIYRGPEGDVLVRWDAVEGARYRVQHQDVLGDAGWNDLAAQTFILYSGEAQQQDNPAPEVRGRFYRLKLAD